MDAAAIIGLISSVIVLAEQAVKAGMDVAPFFTVIKNDILGKPASELDQAAIEAKIADLSASIQQPLDPAEPDET